MSPSRSAPDYHTRPQVNLRLSEEAREALERLSSFYGVTMTAVVEQLIRADARKQGLMKRSA